MNRLKEMVEPLLCWYRENKRELPWRGEKNPYYTWISEIMLQQTRVEAVKPYFSRFIDALPTVEAAAVCDEEMLMKLWEGLGYYSRARNIKKAAQIIVDEYSGLFPSSEKELRKLPGIGPYTAGAIASIAFDEPVPAVDGNVLRVVARLTCDEEDILTEKTKKRIREEMLPVMPANASGEFNQALMDLGATVCLPNGVPNCCSCPLNSICLAYSEGRTEELPVRIKKTKRRIENRTVLVIRDGEKMAIHKRPDKGLLAGLYELPNLTGHLSKKEILHWSKHQNIVPLRIIPLENSQHIFSHIEWRMIGYEVRVAALEEDRSGDLLFIRIEEAKNRYPIPSAFAAYAAHAQMKIGQAKFEDVDTVGERI